MPAPSLIDSQSAMAKQLLERLERDGVAYAESLLCAHETLAQSLVTAAGIDKRRTTSLSPTPGLPNSDSDVVPGRTSFEGQSAGYNGTTVMGNRESLETHDNLNLTDTSNSLALPLPEQNYTENHRSAFLSRERYGPWAEDLIGPLLPNGEKSGDEILPRKGDSGNLISGLTGLNVVHDYDGEGSQCSGLAAGAGDGEFWEYIRVTSFFSRLRIAVSHSRQTIKSSSGAPTSAGPRRPSGRLM